MATYGEVVSRIQNTLNSQNKDGYLPRRYILFTFKSKAEFIMSQKLYDKSLFREIGLFKQLNCVELTDKSNTVCGDVEFVRCDDIAISKKKLPKLLWSRYGPSIIEISTVNGDKVFSLISKKDYQIMSKRKGFEKFKGSYAILTSDNYLMIPNSELKLVNILVYTLDETSGDLSTCDSCQECESYWDKEVSVSDKMLESVIGEVLKEVSMRVQIVPDTNPNLDVNEKSKTVQ